MKKRVSVQFLHWWPTPDGPLENFLHMLPFLRERYSFVVSDLPDVTIFSVFVDGVRQRSMPDVGRQGITVFYTAENALPDMARCDYAFSFCHDIDDPRHMRLPNYVLRLRMSRRYGPEHLVRDERGLAEALKRKKRFCAFVHRHPVPFREDFVRRLSRYKRVDCGGARLNNLGYLVGNKLDFLAEYKFAMAFENEAAAGYTTEKIVDAFLAYSVPLYWGDPLVGRDFNPRAFLNYADYSDEEAFIERIIALDGDDELYRSVFNQPCVHGNRVPELFDMGALESRWRGILG